MGNGSTIITALVTLFFIITIVLQVMNWFIKDARKRYIVAKILLVAQLVLVVLLIVRIAMRTIFLI